MTQALRVALWVPTTSPNAGFAIATTGAPAGPQDPIPSQFQPVGAGGGGTTTDFATPLEISQGTVVFEAIDPAGLRGELVRLLGIPSADMTAGDIVTATAVQANTLVKTDSTGKINATLLAGSGTPFATNAEIAGGVVTFEAIDPAGLRAELTRLGLMSGGGGGGTTVSFADTAELAAGVVADEAVAPSTLRGELVRVFGGVSADYTAATVTFDGGTF
jgi:hypothetical protein